MQQQGTRLPLILRVSQNQLDHLDCNQDALLYRLQDYNSPLIPNDNTWLTPYCDQQSDAEQKAGVWMSIPYYINVASSAGLGFLVDRFGQAATICAVAPAVFTVVHVMLGFTDFNAIILLVGQGLAYSFYAAALWPPVVYIVEEKYIGAAYGTPHQRFACT